MIKKTIMVSGGFDPVHVGHIRMIQEAAESGDLIKPQFRAFGIPA